MNDCLFGQAEVNITPPLGTWLVGYTERDHGCEAVHDPLYAKAWIFSDGRQTAALLFLDICIIDRLFTARVREQTAAATGIPPQHIHLSYTHTHSAPACVPGGIDAALLPQPDPELEAIMARHCSGVIAAAQRSLRKGRLGLGAGRLTGICTNRRDPDGLMDSQVKVLRLEEADGRLAGAIVNYGCHPTVLHADNYLVSRDLPGFMCDAVQAASGGKVQVAFGQGAGADTSTRWTRRGTTFNEAARLGRMLAGEALRALEATECSSDLEMRLATETLELPTRRLPSPERAEHLLAEETARLEALRASGAPYGAIRSAYVAQQGAALTLERSRHSQPPTRKTEVAVIKLGDISIAILPGETFGATGLAVKEGLGANALVLGYANDWLGYLIPPEEEAVGGYEVNSALLQSSASTLIRDRTIALGLSL